MLGAREKTVLILGDGNFSFSLALADLLNKASETKYYNLPYKTRVTSTSFDSHAHLITKYPESIHILGHISKYPNFTVEHDINACHLATHYPEVRFDVIIWNHPHLGTEDFKRHQFLLAHFFKSVTDVLSPEKDSLICVSLVEGNADIKVILTHFLKGKRSDGTF